MRKFILPAIVILVLGAILFAKGNNRVFPKRGIASVSIEITEQNVEEDDSPLMQGNDCVECRLAEMQIQNLFQMMQTYAMNQVILNQLGTPQMQQQAPNSNLSIMEQMGNFTDQLFATNPLVTGTLNQFDLGMNQAGNNSLSLSGYSSGYGFDYNSYLGVSEAPQLTEVPAFEFSAPAMDSDPTFRRMNEDMGGFGFFNSGVESPIVAEPAIVNNYELLSA